MNSIFSLLQNAAKELENRAEIPLREARLLLAHSLNIPYETLFFSKDYQLTEDETEAFHKLLQRRKNYEPLSKITEKREFWSLPFRVTKDTLDPRPDSETLIEAVLSFFPDKKKHFRILDLGTGTGCLLLSLLHEYPNAWGVGVDYNEATSSIAKQNAAILNLSNRACFIVGNWCESLSGYFDIIISNPPYVRDEEFLPPEVALFDPKLALYGGNDGLKCYRELSSLIPNLLTPYSLFFLELGAGQLDAITSIFSNLSLIKTVSDLGIHTRCGIFAYKPVL
ncbi:MAG: peptide chain release factor N(5)-glutamine methyltransferase [Alphaproteobacteria bacterium]|nr:peptide chain release factor N(5)-glutamine methyltransferase [Alphaproteobacteria bacterium]